MGAAAEPWKKRRFLPLKNRIKQKQTTGGSQEEIDSYNEYRVNK